MAQVQDNTTSIFRSIDWWTILIYIVLLAMGWISVVGASYSFDNTDILDFSARSGKQLTWIGCSLVLGLILLLTDDRLFDTLANIIYVAMMALLLVTPFIATNIKGSYSWISLGAVNIQPAEFAKCATALALAGYMGSYNFTLEDRKKFLGALTMVLLPIVLIFLQRETGSALVY
ncbi:MAG: FtsW/RodA/SpoVE family cell cycle protein, partial [Bacteroidaceae bacterium]